MWTADKHSDIENIVLSLEGNYGYPFDRKPVFDNGKNGAETQYLKN